MSILSKDIIKKEILAYLASPKRGKKPSEELLIGIIELIYSD